jgi:hypothetical protein
MDIPNARRTSGLASEALEIVWNDIFSIVWLETVIVLQKDDDRKTYQLFIVRKFMQHEFKR